jgi:hypothetical protein
MNSNYGNLKIDFLIIGAQKSGSTSLYHYLRQHPEIYLPEIEENRFFTKNEFYRQGVAFLKPFYRHSKSSKVKGGKNVHIMYFPDAPSRIHKHNPDMKLIAILRNPIDRAYSAYWFARRNGWEYCKTFEQALELEFRRTQGTYEERAELTYLTHGHYYEQLRRVINLFGQTKVLTFLTDDLKQDPQNVISRIFDWFGLNNSSSQIDYQRRSMVAAQPRILGLQKLLMSRDIWYRRILRKSLSHRIRHIIQRKVINKVIDANLEQANYPPMRQTTRKNLSQYFTKHNARLSGLIDRDLSHW